MAAVLLSLGASLSFGVADFLGGIASRRIQLLAVLLVSQAAGLAGIAVLVAARGDAPPARDAVAAAALAGVFGTVGIACLYRGLAVGLMSVVAPIAATAAVVPVAWGAFSGEAPSALADAGIALALAGVVLVSRAERAGRSGPRLAGGAGLGIVAAVAFGCFFIAFDRAADDDPYWAALVLRITSVALVAIAALALRPSFRMPRRGALVLPVVGLLDLAGNALFAVASTKGLVGVVSVLSSLYPVVTVALARAFLGERLGRVQAVGVAAAFGGVVLISLA